MRMWALAVAVAIAGTRALHELGMVDLAASRYLATAWNPVASIVGGLVFGYGMALVGACGFGALARLGGGDLRGLVIALVMGISAYIASGGLLSGVRQTLFPNEALAQGDTPSGIGEHLERAAGLPDWSVAAAFSLALLVWALRSAAFRRARSTMFWGVVAGGAIVSGWAATGWLAERTASSRWSRPRSTTPGLSARR